MSSQATVQPRSTILRRRGWPVLIVVLVAIVFGRTVGFDFLTFDDELHLVNNPRLHPFNGAGLVAIWARPYAELYIPATYTAWGLLTPFARAPLPAGQPGWTLNPDVFHLANVALHAANALLVWLILRRVVVADGAAAVGALAFALHPMQVEPVAWISGFKDTFSGFWSLLAILLLLRARRRPMFAAATLAYAVALCAKPASVVVPPIAWVLLWAMDCGAGPPSARTRRSRESTVERPTTSASHVRAEDGPAPSLVGVRMLLVVWIAMAIPLMWATHRLQSDASTMTWNPVAVRPLVAADALAFYGRHLLWPTGLAPDYGRAPTWVWNHAGGSVAVGIAVTIALVATLLWVTRRCGRLVPAGVAVFVVGVGPVLGLVPFTYQQWSTVADRYLYLSMVGVGLVAAWAVRAGGRAVRVSAGIVLAAWAVCSTVQAGVWSDTVTLFNHNLTVNPASAFSYASLGTVAQRAEEWHRSEQAYQRAVDLDPAEPKYQNGLVEALKHEPGRAADAKAHRALGLIAAAHRAMMLYPQSPIAHLGLASAYAQQGRPADAAAERELAARLKAAGAVDPPLPGDHW